MSIRAPGWKPGDLLAPRDSLFGDEADVHALRRGPDADQDVMPASASDQTFVDILRGVDLDALLAGPAGSDFLFQAGREHVSPDGFQEEARPFSKPGPEVWADPVEPLVLPGSGEAHDLAREADVAQVLPGLDDDDFILAKDADLPLVLPGELDSPGELALEPSFGFGGASGHMLTLDPGEGGFRDLADEIGLLNDHDGWLF
ncbi:MAG: hypothetical protein IR159_09885 [Brevundimonas sp.]|nr:hypothetical protein [Brevundimonas sp.]